MFTCFFYLFLLRDDRSLCRLNICQRGLKTGIRCVYEITAVVTDKGPQRQFMVVCSCGSLSKIILNTIDFVCWDAGSKHTLITFNINSMIIEFVFFVLDQRNTALFSYLKTLQWLRMIRIASEMFIGDRCMDLPHPFRQLYETELPLQIFVGLKLATVLYCNRIRITDAEHKCWPVHYEIPDGTG